MRYRCFELYEGRYDLEDVLRWSTEKVRLHITLAGAATEREQDAADDRRAELGIEDPTAKPDNIPQDLWDRMSPQFRKQVRQSKAGYNPSQIRRHLDKMDEADDGEYQLG